MSNRVSRALLEHKIETVRYLAEKLEEQGYELSKNFYELKKIGLRTANGQTYLTLREPFNGCETKFGTARGNREVAMFLDGIIETLYMLRQTLEGKQA